MSRTLWRYTWRMAAGDVSGGVIAALIALPYGLAMASLMGLPPILGIFTSLLSAPVTAVLGRNPVLIGGTSAATVPFIAAAVKQCGPGGAAKVVLVAAVFLLVFSSLRFGRFVRRIPLSVVTGFSCGIGAMMVITQLRTIFGLEGLPAGGTLLGQLVHAATHLGRANWQPFLLAFVTILVSTLAANLSHRLPAPLIGLLAGLGVSRLLRIHDSEVGALALDMPVLASFQWRPSDIVEVLPEGLALAFVIAVNLLLTSRVVEHFRGRHRPLRQSDADAELGAYGIANMVCGILGAPATVGIPARSLANIRCGGTTRASILVHALILFAAVSGAGPLLAHIPLSALAGVTAWMGFCLLDWSAWRRLTQMWIPDAAAFLSTFAGILLFNPIYSVGGGCVIHYLLSRAPQWMRQTAERPLEPQVTE
ncbi:MAG: SulP family inorganic anion transporter [Bryobacteraceae bacterium]